MTPTEAAKLVRLVRAVCPAQHIDEWTPEAWTEILAGCSFDDARVAVMALASVPMPPGTSLFIGTNQILDGVQKIRGRRLQDTPMPQPPAGLDPGDYQTWHRQTREAIANGTYHDDTPELPGPAEPGRFRELLAATTPSIAAAPEHLDRRRRPDVDELVDQAQLDAERARQQAELAARIESETTHADA